VNIKYNIIYYVFHTMQTLKNLWIIVIAWPDWVGKWYITQEVCKILGFKSISMITTRPSRSWDSKISISNELFNNLSKANLLIWEHINLNWYKYAYLKKDFRSLKNNDSTIIEINPTFQNYSSIVKELNKLNIPVLWFIWLTASKKYLQYNIKSRTPNITEDELEKKIVMWKSITKSIASLIKNNKWYIINISFKTRNKLITNFIDILAQL
jgi:hypothetical protein